MANTDWLKKPAYEQIQEFVADASLAIDIGDLMYLDTDDAKPASSQADQLTEAANQELFASKFVGVATSARLASDTAAGVVRVQCDGLFEMTCTSATFEIGDLVGADEASSGTALEDQSVKKVTDASLAIGVVVQRYASATTKVWCRLINRVSWDLAHKVGGAEDLTVIEFTGATGVNEIVLQTNLADALSVEDSAGDLIVIDTTTGTQVITITPNTVISGTLGVTGMLSANGGITLGAGDNIVLATGTGTKIGTATTQLLGFYNATPVDQPAALTTQLTSITHTAPGSPDYALQDLVQNTGFGFVTADEGNTLLSVVLNLQVRCAELEARLEELGLVAAN